MTAGDVPPLLSQPAVSVVIPAFNVRGFLPPAVELLLQQTIPVQIVVVDDASTDGTADTMAEIATRHPQVTFIPLTVNGGVAAARQAGVAAARGRYIWFLDADDVWAADGAERLLAAAVDSGSDIVCAGAEYIAVDGSRRPVPSLPAAAGVVDAATAFRSMLVGRISGHLWNKLFAVELFGRIEFTRSRVHSDQAMVAQLLVAAQRISGLDDVVYGYRLRSGSIIRSGSQRAESLETVTAVVQTCATELGLQAGPEFAYYMARFSLLSRMKDATSGAYPDQQTRDLVRRARREMTPAVFGALVRRKDAKRLALLAAARLSLPLYRRLMSREGARS